MNIYIKWTLIVCFNAIFCMIFAFDFMKTIGGALGVIAGIICFILFYAKLDKYLLNSKSKEWRKALFIAVITTGLLSLYPILPMISGSIALEITGSFFNLPPSGILHKSFLSIFSTTVITGGLLSLLVLSIAVLVRVFLFIHPILLETGDDSA